MLMSDSTGDNKTTGQGPLPPFKSWRPRRTARPGTISKLWVGVGVVVLIAAVLITGLILLARRRPAKPVAVMQTPTDTTWRSRSFVVKSGEIMSTLLTRARVPESTATRIITALRYGKFNFRRMRPGDSLALMYRDNQLLRVLYHQSHERIYRLDLDSADCRVSMVYQLISRTPDLIQGHIENSLYQAMLELGEKPGLIADFADIFGWEIDFFSETRKNDSFTILVERKLADSSFIGYGPILAARYKGRIGDFYGFRFTDPDKHTDYYNAEAQSLRKTFLKSPLHFSRITSFFGMRYHPIRRIRCKHSGIDYAAPTGTPVSCVADGRVTFTGWKGGYGKLVEVAHANGFITRYGHLSRYGKGTKSGVHVTQGQTIGYVGSTGLSTGPHLHYEVSKFGTPTNPLRMKVPRAEPVKKAYLEQFRTLRDSLQQVMAQMAGAMRPPQPDQEQH